MKSCDSSELKQFLLGIFLEFLENSQWQLLEKSQLIMAEKSSARDPRVFLKES